METIRITEDATGATADIAVALGLNCFSYRAPADGKDAEIGMVELLHAAEAFRDGNERPSGSGIPILFPFPGRLRGESFRYDGREYALEAGDGRENAIHGFVFTRPWRVLHHEGNRLEAQFTASIDDPAILEHWPADFQITAIYSIEAARLRLNLRIENPGEAALPWGLGLHPYLRAPMVVEGFGDAVGGERRANSDCTLQVPVAQAWELVDMLPTGKVLAASDIEGTGGGDLRTGIEIADHHLDDVFTAVEFTRQADYEEPVAVGRVVDAASGQTIRVAWSEVFRECVLYTPGHREAVCIEPYTCVPDAYTLAEQGIETGLQVLQPGETATGWMEIGLE